MRKILVFIMSLVMIMTLTACATDGNTTVCQNCGKTVSEGAKFCAYCGTALTTEEYENKEEAENPKDEKQEEKNPVVSWDGSVADSYESGDGTPENPYEIANASQLARLSYETNEGRVYPGQYFYLSNNIMLNNPEDVYPYYDDENVCVTGIPLHQWTPIGTEENPFMANFLGGNYTIYGLVISDDWDYAGLFGYVTNASIHSVHMDAEFIVSTSIVGGIAACIMPINGGLVNITSCSVNGKLWSLGGINNGFSSSYMELAARDYVGGIVGRIFDPKGTASAGTVSVEKCINYTHVLGFMPQSYRQVLLDTLLGEMDYSDYTIDSKSIGGIVGNCGSAKNGYVYIKNCVNAGLVEERHVGERTGGLVGNAGGFSIENSINMASVISPLMEDTGAIIGYAGYSGQITNCWFVPDYCSTPYGDSNAEYLDIKATTEKNATSLDWLVDNLRLDENEWTMVDGKLAHKAAVEKKMD